jgi:EamA-like transporter family
MSEPARRRAAEAGLVGIAAVWGLTFVMVRDALDHLPAMAFLGYRFASAALLVALVFRRRLRRLSRDGLRAGALMGVFLTAGYVFQTLGLEHTSASDAGFITGLFVVLTPVLGAAFLAERISRLAWGAAVASASGLYLLSGTGGQLRFAGDGLELLCATAFAAHILVTWRAAPRHDAGALLAVRLAVCGPRMPRGRGRRRAARATARRHRLVGPRRDLGGRERPRLLRPDLRPTARRARPHRPHPGLRTGVRRAVRLPRGRRASLRPGLARGGDYPRLHRVRRGSPSATPAPTAPGGLKSARSPVGADRNICHTPA